MAATDDFAAYSTAPPGPCRHAAAVTPSDSTDLSNVSRLLYVGGAGDVALVTEGGETPIFHALPAGTLLPVCATRVKATGTTATNLTALW